MLHTRLHLIALLLVVGLNAQAQTGIRFTVVDFERPVKKFHPNILFGLERDLSSRLSIGLDVVKSFRLDPEPMTGDHMFNGYQYPYTYSTTTWGMQYRSIFFLTESFYMGSTIGFRQFTMTVDPDPYGMAGSYSGTPFPDVRKETGRTTLVPMGLRFGLRSELDGWYADMYIAVGYNVGAGRDHFRYADYLDSGHALNGEWISLGYAMGIGW